MMRELQSWECFQLAESAVGGDEGQPRPVCRAPLTFAL